MSISTNARQTNFDVLRSLAMLMVVVWHFYFYAIGPHPFPASLIGTANYVLSELIVICSSVCVNIFILIASYFLLDRPLNTKRILLLWFQVVFYSLGITVLGSFIFAKDFNLVSFIHAIFPVTNNNYWFFTNYLGLVILAPFFSKTASSLSKRDYNILLIALVALCCTFSLRIPLGNTLGASKGYSLLWFIALFFWGAYYRRFGTSLSKRQCLLLFMATVVFALLFCSGKALYRYLAKGEAPELEFLAYNGFAFPLAIFLFLVFLKSSCSKGVFPPVFAKVSPYSFGVYLISEHYLIRPFLWETGLPWSSFLHLPYLIPFSLVFCLLIYFLCVGIDWGRSELFRIFHLPNLIDDFHRMLEKKRVGIPSLSNKSEED